MLRRTASSLLQGTSQLRLQAPAAAEEAQRWLPSCYLSTVVDQIIRAPDSAAPFAWEGALEVPGTSQQLDCPQLCSVPKRRHSLHKRGQRRAWYKVDRQQMVARCRFCGTVSLPHEFSAHKPSCTGKCLEGLKKQYPIEHKPPC